MLNAQQRLVVDRDFEMYNDGQLAIFIGATRNEVTGYRKKVGLIKRQNRVSVLLKTTDLKDEISECMILGYSLRDMERELCKKYLLSLTTIRNVINNQIHWSTRKCWKSRLIKTD